MNKEKALALLHDKIKSVNLRRHCYAVASVMKSLARHLGGNEKVWEIAGLVHDLDYEEYPNKHPLVGLDTRKKENYPKEIIDAVAAHAWGCREDLPMPKNKMEWSLYTCDELTGLIVAVTLVRPTKKIADVTVENVLSKWDSKSFAAGVKRSQIEMCEEKLGIKLSDFIQIDLAAMQEISEQLGL